MAIWSLIMDTFGDKWARYRPADSILRPTSLIWIHKMTMEGLNTCETPQAPLEWTKAAMAGTILGRCFGLWESCFEANFGMNGEGEEVALFSGAAIYLIGM